MFRFLKFLFLVFLSVGEGLRTVVTIKPRMVRKRFQFSHGVVTLWHCKLAERKVFKMIENLKQIH